MRLVIPLPLVLSSEDLIPKFRVGQKIIYRRHCEATVLEISSHPAEGIWYTIQLEDLSGEPGMIIENVVSKDLRFRLGDQPSTPAPRISNFQEEPEIMEIESPEIIVPQRKKRRPLVILPENSYPMESEISRSSESASDSSGVYSPISIHSPPKPVLRRPPRNIEYAVGGVRPFIHKSGGDRIQCYLMSKTLGEDSVLRYDIRYDDGSVARGVPSTRIVPCQPDRPLESITSDTSTISVEIWSQESVSPKHIPKSSEEFLVCTGEPFVHVAENGERVQCFLNRKYLDRDGVWRYLIVYDDGEEADVSGAEIHSISTRKNWKDFLKAGKVAKSGISEVPYSPSSSSGDQSPVEISRSFTISRKKENKKHEGKSRKKSDSPLKKSALHSKPGFSELLATNLEIETNWGKADLSVWLSVYVSQASALSLEDRLLSALRILPKIGDYFATRKPGNFKVACYGLASVAALARAADLESPDVSTAVRAACALSVVESVKDRTVLRPAQVRDALWAPASVSPSSESSWLISAGILLLCTKSMSKDGLQAVSNFFLAKSSSVLQRPDFFLQFFPSLGSAGISLLSRGDELVNRASRELSDEVRLGKGDARREDVLEGCWRTIALALDDELMWFEGKKGKAEGLLKSGGFGIVLDHDLICGVGKYQGKTFAEVVAVKGYASWVFENVKPPWSPKMKAWIEYASRMKQVICPTGKSVFEQAPNINKDNFVGWAKKMAWACNVSLSILTNVSRDIQRKDVAIAYLEGMKLSFANTLLGLPVLPALASFEPHLRAALMEDVVKPLESIRIRCTS